MCIEGTLKAGSKHQSKNYPVSRQGYMHGIIYKATGPDGKVYIGQTMYTLAHRKACHRIQAVKRDRRGSFQLALLELGVNAFTWEQIDTAETAEELDAKEKYWIAHYDSMNPKRGYNNTDGGVKTTYSEATCRRISEALKGKKRSKEICQKMSEAQKKRFQTQKGTMLGKKHSVEALVKMSEAQKRNMHLGEKNPSATITENIARQIKSALVAGDRICHLARKHNVTSSLVKNIKYGRAWAWLQAEEHK